MKKFNKILSEAVSKDRKEAHRELMDVIKAKKKEVSGMGIKEFVKFATKLGFRKDTSENVFKSAAGNQSTAKL